MEILEKFNNIVTIAVITAFLIIPVAVLSSGQVEVIKQLTEFTINICVENPACTYRYYMASLGTSILIMVSILIAFLEAVRSNSRYEMIGDIAEDTMDILDWINTQEIIKEEEADKKDREDRRASGKYFPYPFRWLKLKDNRLPELKREVRQYNKKLNRLKNKVE